LYTGVTNNILNRDEQHKIKLNKNSFCSKYNINRIVYYEVYDNAIDAISREKKIKSGSRQKKLDLINSINKDWEDIVEISFY
jgi:putative endonuclease